MITAWETVVAGLPMLVVHLGVATAIYVVGVTIYLFATPYHELRLIRQGNTAAAVTLSAEMLALAIPLAATLANSVNVPDIVLWGSVSVLLQLIAFAVAAVLLRRTREAIELNEVATALVVAAIQLAAGLLNAAAMTG